MKDKKLNIIIIGNPPIGKTLLTEQLMKKHSDKIHVVDLRENKKQFEFPYKQMDFIKPIENFRITDEFENDGAYADDDKE